MVSSRNRPWLKLGVTTLIRGRWAGAGALVSGCAWTGATTRGRARSAGGGGGRSTAVATAPPREPAGPAPPRSSDSRPRLPSPPGCIFPVPLPVPRAVRFAMRFAAALVRMRHAGDQRLIKTRIAASLHLHAILIDRNSPAVNAQPGAFGRVRQHPRDGVGQAGRVARGGEVTCDAGADHVGDAAAGEADD